VCPREESNLYCRIRNPASYPLNDEGVTNFCADLVPAEYILAEFLQCRHSAGLATARRIRLDITGLDGFVEDLIDGRYEFGGANLVLGCDEFSESFDVLLNVGFAAQIENALFLGGTEGFLG
jgi:hypothetical protein